MAEGAGDDCFVAGGFLLSSAAAGFCVEPKPAAPRMVTSKIDANRSLAIIVFLPRTLSGSVPRLRCSNHPTRAK